MPVSCVLASIKAKWSEIDGGVWTVPPSRMKTNPRMVAEGTSVDDAIISQRFVPAPDSKPAKPIVVLNWVEELKRLVPTE